MVNNDILLSILSGSTHHNPRSRQRKWNTDHNLNLRSSKAAKMKYWSQFKPEIKQGSQNEILITIYTWDQARQPKWNTDHNLNLRSSKAAKMKYWSQFKPEIKQGSQNKILITIKWRRFLFHRGFQCVIHFIVVSCR